MKLALGATPNRLAMGVFGEGALLSSLAAIGGSLSAWLLCPLVSRLLPPLRDAATNRLPLAITIGVDWRVLAFCSAVSALTCFLVSLVRIVTLSRVDIATALRVTRSTTGLRLRYAILTVQVGVCTAVAVFACMAIRTFEHLRWMNPGFDAAHVITVATDPTLAGYNASQLKAFRETVSERLRSVPGVALVATASRGVLRDSGIKTTVAPAGKPILPEDQMGVSMNGVSVDYFKAMGAELLRGRDFIPSDATSHRPGHVVVNETFAQRFFAGEDPIGRTFGPGTPVASPSYEIVGMVRDAKYRSLREPMTPTFFALSDSGKFVLCVRTLGPPKEFVEPIRRAILSIDPALPITEIHTLADEMDASASPERLTSWFVSLFAAFAIVLLSAGLYALFELVVLQRKKEIGIRIALGARPQDITRLLVLPAATISAAGIAAGAMLVVSSSPLIKAWVYGIPPLDPPSLGIGVLVVGAVSAFGVMGPSWRARSITPAAALREVSNSS